MDAIELMMEEHKNIKKALQVIRTMCIGILNGVEVDYEDFNKIIAFVRNYADKHHHNKEEVILFKKMQEEIGEDKVSAPIQGMLIEHDFGRLFMKGLEEAVEKVKAGEQNSRVDVIANAIGYTDLLTRHIDKEDKVIYQFARRSLSNKSIEEVNKSCEQIEMEAENESIQKTYINILEELENKWLNK
ncbi:MAG: hemerythrin domain-containing protein [Bacillota bacterium]|nr:hemerythrin domain-containing protein [Bacillota bacterium]